jgi:UDP-2,3-diacylglucosamine pyrophosphatase LpxH
MLISRAKLIRGALAGGTLAGGTLAAAALPGFAYAAQSDAFRSDAVAGGPHPWTAPPPGGAGPLRFVVIGDNTGVAKPGVFDAAMRQISWLQPDFVLSVGDLIEGYTEDRAEIARQWDAIDASIAKCACPFLFTVGNHDVDNAETLDASRARRGPGHYSFTYKGALFIVLNTEATPTPMPAKAAGEFYERVRAMQADPDKYERDTEAHLASSSANQASPYASLEVVNLDDEQLGFVQRTLAKYPAPRWTFVSIHKPAWKMHSDSFAKVQAMLMSRPHTVFAGHTHYFTHEVFGGHDYINMGSTGGVRHRDGVGTMDHVLVVTLAPHGPVYANTRLNGLMDVAGQTGQVRAY